MQLNRFDLNLLIALDALLHEKNVTRAAERVFLSQPAMSASLQKLRDYFQDALLVRVGREMELTPRALSLVQPVREALLKVQATLGTQPTFDPATVRRTYTVIATDEAVPELVPRVLGRMAREAPQIQCHVEQVSQTSLTKLSYGDADLCLSLNITRVYGLGEFPETLKFVPLRPVRWVCVMSKEQAIPGDSMTLADYQALPHVFARPNSDRHRMLILNSCIQRMPTIESLGLHELLGTASGASRGSTAPARSLSCLPGS